MVIEEREDAPAGILGGGFVVTCADERPQDGEQDTVVVVEERMSGTGIFCDVVINTEFLKSSFEPVGSAAQHAILASEAADDRTGSLQGGFSIHGDLTIVYTCCCKSVAGSQQQSEAAPHAEADNPDPAGAGRLSAQPLSRGVNVFKSMASTSPQITEGDPQTGRLGSPGIEVRSNGDIASARQPFRLIAQIIAHAQGIMDHDDPGPRLLTRGLGKITAKPVFRSCYRDVCHSILSLKQAINADLFDEIPPLFWKPKAFVSVPLLAATPLSPEKPGDW